jgi:hypothetical protein
MSQREVTTRHTGEIVVQRQNGIRAAAELVARHVAIAVWLLAVLAGSLAAQTAGQLRRRTPAAEATPRLEKVKVLTRRADTVVVQDSMLMLVEPMSHASARRIDDAREARAASNGGSEKPLVPAPRANYWAGAQMVYTFTGDGDLSNSFVPVGTVQYDIQLRRGSGGYALPIVANFSRLQFTGSGADEDATKKLEALVAGSEGAFLRIEPTIGRPFGREGAVLQAIRASIGAKFNSFKDSASGKATTLAQARLALFHELHVGDADAGPTIDLSYGPTFSFFDSHAYEQVFGVKKRALLGLQATAVVPVSKTLGFLVDTYVTRGAKPVIRTSLLLGGGSG